MPLGERLRQRRSEKGVSAAELARQSGISKGYLSQLENGEPDATKPSAEVLFRIAQALDTTIADLMERETQPADNGLPQGLQDLAKSAQLPATDIKMLAQIRFRGRQPQSEDDWRFLYDAIKRAIPPGK
ncbi:MAG TPA: helix-turn-helix transcriptional regulator [Chloroflexota bacterium]